MSDFFTKAWIRVSTQLAREDGQAVTEYAIVLVLIAAIGFALTQTTIAADIVGKITSAIGGK